MKILSLNLDFGLFAPFCCQTKFVSGAFNYMGKQRKNIRKGDTGKGQRWMRIKSVGYWNIRGYLCYSGSYHVGVPEFWSNGGLGIMNIYGTRCAGIFLQINFKLKEFLLPVDMLVRRDRFPAQICVALGAIQTQKQRNTGLAAKKTARYPAPRQKPNQG